MLQHFMPQQPARPDAVASAATSDAAALSEREHEVLRLIEKGLTYDEIAQVLGIT